MNRTLCVIVMAGIVWSTAGVLYSGEETSPRTLVEKAIKAHGGAANLAKFPAVTVKMTGTFYGLGEGLPFTGTAAFQGSAQKNFTIESKINNMTFKFQTVVSGAKGWQKINDDAASELSKEELVEEQEKMFARDVTTLVPLKDKSFDLALIGEAKVGEKPVIGVRVSKKGHRDVSLYFDKKSGLLLKFETPAKDVKAGEEYTETTICEEYKDFKGLKRATKVLIQKDGKKLVEAEMTECQPLEKLENSTFNQP